MLMSTLHTFVTNPNWQEADQFTINIGVASNQNAWLKREDRHHNLKNILKIDANFGSITMQY